MARGRSADPLGKLTNVTVGLPESVVERLREIAAEEGISAAQFVRDLLTVRVLGREHAVMLHATRLDRIAGIPTRTPVQSTPGINLESTGLDWEREP